jgi:HD superfamily phosphohydrolase
MIHTLDRGFTTAIKEPGLAALESYCITRSRSHQVFVRHHKVSQVGTALRYACAKLLEDPTAQPLLDFLAGLSNLKHGNDDDRRLALEQYAALDDTWAFQALRQLRKSTSDPLLAACLDVALDRTRTLRSVWKRKGDLSSEQFGLLQTRFKELTSPKTGPLRLQEARRRLLEHGVLLALLKFSPYVEERATKESVMLILSRREDLQPASRMSPLIRHLKDAWEEDIHLYAFTELNNRISIDEVLRLMGPDPVS